MRYFIFILISYFSFVTILFSELTNGLILYSNSQGIGPSNTYIINNNYNTINTWHHSIGAIGIPYLNQDGSIILQFRSNDHYFGNTHGPVGGILKKLDWNGNVLWVNHFFNEQFQPHHDLEVLPNGNILIIAWEKKSYQDAQSFGRIDIVNEIWPLVIYEIEPVDTNEINIIWEWHLWDHLIQDVDSNLINYGQVSDHPELIDINIGQFTEPSGGDWLHTNAIAYNNELDQIVFSSKHFNEVFIIDHSTTSEEASSHQGGNSNKGGDILYRWGNPKNYNRGNITDQKLNAQHGVHWIPIGMPGSGNLLIYNNNPTNTTGLNNSFGNSSVVEIITPLDSNGNYYIELDSAYGPVDYHWEYGGDNSFFSSFQSGAYRLQNGNSFITVSQERRLFEIDSSGNIMWEYDFENHSHHLGYTARAMKYDLDYLETINGDLSRDFLINIFDLLIASDLLLDEEYVEFGDLNDDNYINIDDIDSIINLIMNF